MCNSWGARHPSKMQGKGGKPLLNDDRRTGSDIQLSPRLRCPSLPEENPHQHQHHHLPNRDKDSVFIKDARVYAILK